MTDQPAVESTEKAPPAPIAVIPQAYPLMVTLSEDREFPELVVGWVRDQEDPDVYHPLTVGVGRPHREPAMVLTGGGENYRLPAIPVDTSD